MLGYSSVTEQREQPLSFWLVMSFIKFWVAFMGFFFFSIVPWVLRLRQLFLLLMCKRKEQLYKCRYSEAALHVFMWRIWDHSWYRSLKTACPCFGNVQMDGQWLTMEILIHQKHCSWERALQILGFFPCFFPGQGNGVAFSAHFTQCLKTSYY